jgi:hypothetical protein
VGVVSQRRRFHELEVIQVSVGASIPIHASVIDSSSLSAVNVISPPHHVSLPPSFIFEWEHHSRRRRFYELEAIHVLVGATRIYDLSFIATAKSILAIPSLFIHLQVGGLMTMEMK